jgi:hypothetical protein
MKSFILIFTILLFGCASAQQQEWTQILGSGSGFYIGKDAIVVNDMQVSKLRIRVVKRINMKKANCEKGNLHTIEINGEINKDAVFVLDKILRGLQPCYDKESYLIPNIVYMNSSGGYLNDGYAIGDLFRKYDVGTVVTDGQVCASSCAVAFLGGNERIINSNGRLVFHAPYINTKDAYGFDSIKCSDRNSASNLRNYYQKMIPSENANILYDRTMDYCSKSDGWTLDSGAAKFFGIIN